MASPPSSHPLLRPAVSVAQTANSSQPGIAYYRPLTAGSESEVTAQALASSPPPERSIGTASPVPFAGSGASGVGASAGATTGSSVNTPTSPTSTADIPNLTPSSRVASPPPLGRAGSLTRPPGGFRASAAEAGSVAAPETVSAPATNGTGHRKPSRWEEKVQSDLTGWRGGAENEKPYSSVPQQGQDASTYYGQPATGTIGQDLPKEILRVERDWILGDVCQFSLDFPTELESRITDENYKAFIESVNTPLREAYSVGGAVVDNLIAVATWWTSLFWRTSHFEKELRKAEEVIRHANEQTFNPVGLNILSPRSVGLQYLEIEYY